MPAADKVRHTEEQDIAAIVQGILKIQAREASAAGRPLARGTHAKGVCASARLEVLDLTATIPDQQVAARLARGLYATPATYPATVRFANADSGIKADREPDVRALSFAVEPAGTKPRLDFSANDRPTFPINDAHAFATVVQVFTAPSMGRAIWSLSFTDKLSFGRTAVLGQLQKRQALLPYQHRRYWSTVPFRHGPDEVVKYSATPCAENPAGDLNPDDPNTLQNELARHLDSDSRMSCFDFGVQFLDTRAMTYWGRRRDADFWIENASVEWNEEQSPFHTVARLTLTPKSQIPPATCEAWHIDVTENSTPDNAPVGSINRARWHAEAASRQARLGK
jgi:hypothetical protein